MRSAPRQCFSLLQYVPRQQLGAMQLLLFNSSSGSSVIGSGSDSDSDSAACILGDMQRRTASTQSQRSDFDNDHSNSCCSVSNSLKHKTTCGLRLLRNHQRYVATASIGGDECESSTIKPPLHSAAVPARSICSSH